MYNFKEGKYEYVSENMRSLTGYSATEYYRNGVELHLNRMHPDDMKVFTNEVINKVLEKIHSLDEYDLPNCRFSVNYRYKRSDSSYMQALQQYYVLQRNQNGDPLIVGGIVADISHFKKDTGVLLQATHYKHSFGTQIFHDSAEDGEDYHLYHLNKKSLEISKQTLFHVPHGEYHSYPIVSDQWREIKHQKVTIETKSVTASSNKNGELLTLREREFVKYCCTEMTYKEIAHKMKVSQRTVDGYRDSIFSKLNIKSRTGIVLYGVQREMMLG
jgi:DNA-binding CsgD family transcriptional regulator